MERWTLRVKAIGEHFTDDKRPFNEKIVNGRRF
jgi:hypothetical protein